MALEKGSVCVTGAGGYLASWVVKRLLSKDYLVHGTVEVIEPAVKGTLNVLKACAEAKVKRVVIVSSGSAVLSNPSWPKGKVMDENCWSDKEYCRATKNWYNLSKTEAESEAWEYAKRSGLDVVAICPSLILGPVLQSTVNASTMMACDSLENKLRPIIDVRDVTAALLLAYETPEAEGRYICTAHAIRWRNRGACILTTTYPKSFTEEEQEAVMMGSEKLQRLGWSFRSLEETLIDLRGKNYQKTGLLD
ncbi:cinnamoyl-CoA reductase 2-like [Populus alba x Populus x berolinensis]|nr:cinnamoyl-CoA reductase 2-like [Populus alba x Populus x berolinensis]